MDENDKTIQQIRAASESALNALKDLKYVVDWTDMAIKSVQPKHVEELRIIRRRVLMMADNAREIELALSAIHNELRD